MSRIVSSSDTVGNTNPSPTGEGIAHDTTESSARAPGPAMVDPRTPRFAQTVSMLVLLVGIGLQEPLLIVAITVSLDVTVLSGWRLAVFGAVWRRVMVPIVGPPEATEPASPHRFAMLLGAVLGTISTTLLYGAPVVSLPELALVGYAVALFLAAAAGFSGVRNYCIGCKMYSQVAFFRRLGWV